MTTEQREKSIDYAKNYPVADQDGNFGNITVGNVSEYDGRTIVNLCLRTAKSGELNATTSYPSDWAVAKRYKAGDIVDVSIVDGYVKIKQLSKFKAISKSPVATVNAVAAKIADETKAETATKAAIEEAMELEPVAEGKDMPF